MKVAGQCTRVGYRRPLHRSSAPPSIVAPNHLDVGTPNEPWVTDTTYIRTHEGWQYLALLIGLRRRKPTSTVMVHSDQGSQYTSHDWQDFLKSHGLKSSMSRRGNCHYNAVAESFFKLLKCERIMHHAYTTRDEARAEIFDYIEMFYSHQTVAQLLIISCHL